MHRYSLLLRKGEISSSADSPVVSISAYMQQVSNRAFFYEFEILRREIDAENCKNAARMKIKNSQQRTASNPVLLDSSEHLDVDRLGEWRKAAMISENREMMTSESGVDTG